MPQVSYDIRELTVKRCVEGYSQMRIALEYDCSKTTWRKLKQSLTWMELSQICHVVGGHPLYRLVTNSILNFCQSEIDERHYRY